MYLRKLQSNCLKYIEDNTQKVGIHTISIYNKEADAHLLSTCFSVLSLHLLQQKERANVYKEFILSCQNEDGYFIDPRFKEEDLIAKHNKDYLSLQFTYFSMLALATLDTAPNYSLKFLEPFYDKNYMKKWIDNLNWSCPWLESNNVMFIICLLSNRFTKNLPKETLDIFFGTLDAKQNAETGLWGNDTKAILEGVAGAYHFLIPYYFYSRPIFYQEKIIDSTLSLLSKDNLFVADGGGGACEDLDAVDILCKLTQKTEYKKKEIKTVLHRVLKCLQCCQNFNGGFSYRFNPFSINVSSVPKFSIYSYRLYILNILSYPIKRWHYYATWNFSSWQKMPFPLHRSDMWSTYARIVSITTICDLLKIEKGHFLVEPGIGWN